MHSDPIADMATRMRNALSADHASVKIPHSQLKEAIAQLLKKESFIHDYHLQWPFTLRTYNRKSTHFYSTY